MKTPAVIHPVEKSRVIRRSLGLKRCEVWIYPEDEDKLQRAAYRMRMQRDRIKRKESQA